ncbi:MAG: ELM1/GtrOC1 family putative glycosyltransferase [Candidatus Omnitrophica bacterium]|nr:ELM1/GtrOC1 family putative glycosyltransferase [Candidatus Omnitrophota bacterium]
MKNESFIFWIIKIFSTIVRRLPVSVALWLGRVIGTIGYLADHRHRTLAYANLKIAFARQKKTKEIKRILKKVFQNYAQNFVELLRLPEIDPHQYITLEGKEHVDESLKKNKGLILLAMHFGSWELCNFMSKLLGYRYRVVVNPQKRYQRLNDLLNSYRQQAGASLVEPGSGTRDFVKALRNNEIVGMVVDQGGRTGSLVKFFGREASMSIGAIKMALKLGVPVCFCTLVRDQKRAHHKLKIFSPLELESSGDREKDITRSLDKVVGYMEQAIAKDPSEYMWFYKIWKYSKESTIVVLSDQKFGHLNQSRAFAEQIKTALSERAIKCHIEVIDVEFKDEAKRTMFAALSFATNEKISQGRLRYLKWFLKRKSFLEVMSVKGDFVISCGSSLAGVNYFLSQDYHAKSIVLQKPGILSLNRFDLVLLPKHDARESFEHKKNVIFTSLTPNLVDQNYLQDQTNRLIAKFPRLQSQKNPSIGLMIGGESKNHFISNIQVESIIDQVKEVVEKHQGWILVTTSRRTQKDVEETVKRKLSNFALCPFLIIATENNVPEAVGGILGISDIVIISSDSISMISEAVSSGKTVIVFDAENKKTNCKGKHEVFVENLFKQEHVLRAKTHEIGQVLNNVIEKNITTKPICDQQILLEAARQII